ENGRLGIELFEKHSDALDLGVLDAIMPQVSGGECLRVIRRKSPDLPVLMVSGYMEEQATADVEGLGVNAFLHKPFGADGLARAVRRAIGKA
ncbi:MAG: response regulator, partial [Myxococcota bacterium]